MAPGVGDLTRREERLPQDPRRRLLKSWTTVRFFPPTSTRTVSPETLLISDTAYYYKLAYVRSLDPASQSTTPAALDAIATAVSEPTVFDFDPLFKLDAVLAARSHPLFALLRIFLSGGLDDLRTWQQAHADITNSYGITILALPALHPFNKIKVWTSPNLSVKSAYSPSPISASKTSSRTCHTRT
jgi:hypothetical protein